MTIPQDLDERLRQILSDPKILAEIALRGARIYISEYEEAIRETTIPRSLNPTVYLTIAEANLIAAERGGLVDTTRERSLIESYRRSS